MLFPHGADDPDKSAKICIVQVQLMCMKGVTLDVSGLSMLVDILNSILRSCESDRMRSLMCVLATGAMCGRAVDEQHRTTRRHGHPATALRSLENGPSFFSDSSRKFLN